MPLGDKVMRCKAQELSQKIRDEDGVANAVEVFHRHLGLIGSEVPMPTNERELRFLAKAELEPAVQADVWQQAVVEQAGNKVP
ncbi:hypothetical protein A6769_38080 [Nostoc punctiforme NIES-2108]|uniref:Uncharacterized protein n=1 Tax=Nostoc punctiforme NIES-2108 TaxID=1356359 RepID=A0A367S1J8_NOSPU|nr:hypothetical protein A6769_38080 [Nostoc punctiforme NIES-2108]